MGAKRFALATVRVVVIVLLIALVAAYFYLKPPRPDPVLLGIAQVTAADLPAELQGRTNAELQAELNELLAANTGDQPEIWWTPRLSEDDLRTVRLLAKHLGDDRTAVRSLIGLAWKQRFSKDSFEALAALDAAIAEAQSPGLERELAEAHLARGELLENIGLYDWSAIERQRAIDGFAGLEAWDRQAWAITQLANVHGHRRLDFHQAINVYEGLDDLVGKVEPAKLAPAFSLFGYTLMSAGRYPEALERMEQALELAEESGNEAFVIRHLTSLAELQLELNDPVGEAALWQVVDLTSPEVVTRDFAEPLHILAGNYQARGEDERAREVLLEALAALQTLEEGNDPASERYSYIQTNLKSDRFLILVDLGDLCLSEEDYAGALEWFNQAREISGDKDWSALSGSPLEPKFAMAYLGLERYDAAWAELEQTATSNIPGYLDLTDQTDPGMLVLKARIRLGQGDCSGAEELLTKAEEQLPVAGTDFDLRRRSGFEQLRGELALARDDQEAAREHYLAALSLLVQAGRLCPWDSEYRRGLAAEIHTVAGKYISLLDDAGDRQRIDAVKDLLDLVDQARELEFAQGPAVSDETARALQDYRATTRELLNLRSSYDWATGGSQAPKAWEIYTGWRNYDWKYRRELSRQLGRLRREISARITDLEDLAADQLAELKRLDEESWKVVTLANEVL